MEKVSVKKGDKVFFSGNFPGTITEVCEGQLAGMVIVRGERGSVCVGATLNNIRPIDEKTFWAAIK